MWVNGSWRKNHFEELAFEFREVKNDKFEHMQVLNA